MTAQLQMMDQNVNAEHQGRFRAIKEDFYYQNLGQALAKHDVISMFVTAGKQALTEKNIRASWQQVGMLPYKAPKVKTFAYYTLRDDDVTAQEKAAEK